MARPFCGLGRRLAAFLLAVLPSCAAQQWLKVSTPNFELYTTAGDKRGIETIQHFEQIRSFFHNASRGADRRTGRKVRLVAFRGEKEFKPYRPNEIAVAYYLSRGDQDIIAMREAGPEVFRIAVHEYVHLLLRRPGAELPLWINEGLAELYSTLRREGNRTLVGAIIDSHSIVLQRAQWLGVGELTQVETKSSAYNEKERAGIFYAESWALAHMMHFSEGYRPKFDDFMNRLGRGVSAEAAFRESFGKTPREVEKDLKEYMQGTRFRGGLVDVKLEKSAEKPFVEAAPEVELGLTLAELAGGGRSADGKAALLQLAREYPKDAEVAEALGYEAWRSGDREEALRRFEHAIDLGSGNAKLHYECAGLSQEQGRPLSRVTALLEKTTELDPDHRDAWFRLGFAHFAQQRFAEAVIAWGHISRVTSEEAGPFFRSVAYANYRIGRKEAAQRAAGRALEYAKTPDDREKAQELVTFVSADPLRESAAARAAAEPDRAPVLQRRPEPAAAPASSPSAPRLLLHVASGTFTELDCQGAEARLHVMVQNKEHLFLLRPNTAAIKGTEGGIFEFTCGLQKARPVVVEFETSDSLPAGVTGLVRVLDLQ